MAEPLRPITARLEHVCSLCGGKIEPGDTYTRRYKWLPLGKGYNIRKCMECYKRATA